MADKIKPAIRNACKVVCDYHKERRPFTASDAGRVACYAMQDGAEWEDIRAAAFMKCGEGMEISDCEEAKDRLRALAKGLEIAIEVAVLAVPAIAAARRALVATRAVGARANARELAKVEELIESGRIVAERNLQATKELLEKMVQHAPPIIIK